VLSQQASSRKDPDSEREVFRSAGSTVLSWAWFVVAVIVLVDLAVQGRDHAALVTAVLVLAITGVVYACAWRPKIVADSSGIAVVNPLRDHQVPWTAVRKVDVVNAVRVHCEPAPGAARGKIVYSWAVQSSARSARKAALRRDSKQRPRLMRPRVLEPPPSTGPRGYGELPAAAKEALERSPADFTAGRLAERAQHARQAAARAAGLSSGAGQPPAAREPSAGARTPEDAPLLAGSPPPVDGRATAGEQAGAAPGGQPEPWFGNGTGDGRPAGEGAGGPADGSPAPGPGPAAGNGAPAGDQAMTTAQPVAQWAWLSIAAMVVPLAVLLLVALA